MKIYLTGYTGKKVEDLKKAAERMEAIIVDIRMRAASRNPVFARSNLAAALEGRYVHVPQLGNVNYKGTVDEIQIANFADGEHRLRELEQQEGFPAAILLCVCKSPLECHRTVVGNLLREGGWEVEEL